MLAGIDTPKTPPAEVAASLLDGLAADHDHRRGRADGRPRRDRSLGCAPRCPRPKLADHRTRLAPLRRNTPRSRRLRGTHAAHQQPLRLASPHTIQRYLTAPLAAVVWSASKLTGADVACSQADCWRRIMAASAASATTPPATSAAASECSDTTTA